MSSLSVENITHMNEDIIINYIFYTLDQQNSTNIEYTIPETFTYGTAVGGSYMAKS